jgi:predicted transposase YdaD
MEHGILSDFLAQHSTEVFNMLLTEWNTEEWGEVCREEGREKGRMEGREEGRNTVLDLMRQGYTVEQIEARLAGHQVQQMP